jgi:hypothetical protein
LEATNQNEKLHVGHLRDPRVQMWPTHVTIKEFARKSLGNVFITKFICRYKIKMNDTLKITKLKCHYAAIYYIYKKTVAFNYSSIVHKRKYD